MSNEVYYPNHARALKFPWSLYHRPLIESLEKFIKLHAQAGKRVLVIGPGELQEYQLLKQMGLRISILDIDPRVLSNLQQRHTSEIDKAYLVDEKYSHYPEPGTFDLIYAKEVIEHMADPQLFLSKVKDLLVPQGKLWLSTPNYGFFLLPLLESTVLELVARKSGFSRKNIHPSKLSSSLLSKALKSSGYKILEQHETMLKLALVAVAEKEH